MDNTQLLILTGGGVGIVAMIVFAYLGKKGTESAGVLALVLRDLIAPADRLLAPYGAQLAPIHATVEAAQGLFDEDTDPLVRAIKNPAVLRAIRQALNEIEHLTDGELAEAIPQPELPEPTVEELTQ